jgi:hypothetical protein
VEMRKTFISALRLLAQLAREPLSGNRPAAIEQIHSLREKFSKATDKVRALDGMADRLQNNKRRESQNLESSYGRLTERAEACDSAKWHAADLRAFLSLCRRIEDLAGTLDKEI